MERTISFMNGKGSIGHNTRSFIADNVDASRTKNNVTLIHEDIKQVYHKLFDKALDEYNAKQKRKDRQINSYYEKISRSKQEKLFYEVIVQIGNKDDTGVGSSAAEVATWVLKDYVKMFQHRNPQLYVIGAYIHLDEETPHLHLNFVPWVSGCKRGLETKTSLKAALATRGFASEGKGNTEWKQWAEAEKDDIALIMRRYGIDWKKKNTHGTVKMLLPEAGTLERAATYRDKKIKPLFLQIKNKVGAMAAQVKELTKEVENWKSKYQKLKQKYNGIQKELDDMRKENHKLSEEKNIMQGVFDRYDRVVRVLGIETVDAAVQQDIRNEKALEEKQRMEQMPKGSIHERLAWGIKKSEMENQQRKKNKSKNREMER